MPVTYNGVGTRYHGKNNLQTRTGVCRNCRRTVQLQSYDTRLWFVILYIPIVPLGRKHIIDACPACRRHFVTDQDKWETARQLETSGAMDKFRSSPTPENAIAAHQQLIAFNQVAEAAELQKTMLAQFPDNAKICAYLAAAQEHLGRRDQAEQLFKRALELRPDMPEARIGTARGYMRAGRLDDARKMLDFLEKSGAAQLYPLEPLETLARGYQNTGRHQDALDLFGRILDELPKVADHPGFRKAVKTSEKALARDRSILPKQKFSLKRIFDLRSPATGRQVLSPRGVLVLGVLLALVVLGVAISNEYIRHHRQLYLVNGYDTPATVEIPGVGVVRDFKGVRDISLPEGHFHATISGPVNQELDFDVRDSYFGRWSGNSIWFINVGGGALLEETVAVYSQNPGPPTVSFHVGRPFEHLTGVTHPFTTLPTSVQISEGASKTLIQLDLFKGDAADVFVYLENKRSPGEAMTFAESWLGAHPDDSYTLESYAQVAVKQKQAGRLDTFLRAGMTNRPVLIEWHRVYQTLHDHSSEHAVLVSQYESLLQADPTNSALLYLRGRLESDQSTAQDYFKRAAEGDPVSPYPQFALGFDRALAGDWNGAKPLMARAAELDPHEVGFAHWLFLTRLMTGEAPDLEKESRSKLRSPEGSMNYLAEIQLLDSLAAQDKFDDALRASTDFMNLFRARNGSAGDAVLNAVQYHTSYTVGDFEKLKTAAESDRSPAGRTALAVALIERGRPDEAARVLPPDMSSEDKALFDFALALSFRMNGNESAAASWRSRGIDILESGDTDAVVAAGLLKRGTAPTRAEADAIVLQPQVKAIIFAMLSREYPESRAELARVALDSNAERSFPYQLVRRVASISQ